MQMWAWDKNPEWSAAPLDVEKNSEEPTESTYSMRKHMKESQNKWDVLEL